MMAYRLFALFAILGMLITALGALVASSIIFLGIGSILKTTAIVIALTNWEPRSST